MAVERLGKKLGNLCGAESQYPRLHQLYRLHCKRECDGCLEGTRACSMRRLCQMRIDPGLVGSDALMSGATSAVMNSVKRCFLLATSAMWLKIVGVLCTHHLRRYSATQPRFSLKVVVQARTRSMFSVSDTSIRLRPSDFDESAD